MERLWISGFFTEGFRRPNALWLNPPKGGWKVCSDKVDAAYFDEYTALTTLLDGFSCGGQGLRVVQVLEWSGLQGVGSTFDSRLAADAIRRGIGSMAADGAPHRIASRWRSFPGRNLEYANELDRPRTWSAG
jgi:hypothetical protein